MLSLCLLVSALLTRFAPAAAAIHQFWQPRQFQGSAMPFPGGKKHFFLRERRSIFPPGKLLGSLSSLLRDI